MLTLVSPAHYNAGNTDSGRRTQALVKEIIKFTCECGAVSILPNLETPCPECKRIRTGHVTYLVARPTPHT